MPWRKNCWSWKDEKMQESILKTARIYNTHSTKSMDGGLSILHIAVNEFGVWYKLCRLQEWISCTD